MAKLRYKGNLRTVASMNKKELGDYLWTRKSSHLGFSRALKGYLKKRK